MVSRSTLTLSILLAFAAAHAQTSNFLDDFPEIDVVVSNDPAPGYIFFALGGGGVTRLTIVDNEGTPVYYEKVDGTVYDFKWQPNGHHTFVVYPVDYRGYDSSFQYVKNYGLTTDSLAIDVHELQCFEDGSYYMIEKRPHIMDLSETVPNGRTNARVIYNYILHAAPNDSVLWLWNSLEHYDITDVDDYISLSNLTIDLTHCNAVEHDFDGNILLSTRNFNEITKINRETGDIIWRLGGEKNQFTFVNDERRFRRQHDVRRLANGNISIFDNGHYSSPQYSSVVEYEIDTDSMTATLVRRYDHGQDIFTASRGGAQELPNGNWFIDWGESSLPGVTEVKPDDEIALEIDFTNGGHRYKSYKFDWETNYFETDVDTIDFGAIHYGDSAFATVKLFHNRADTVEVNAFFCPDSSFTALDSSARTLTYGDTASVTLRFKPDRMGVMDRAFNFRHLDDTLLLARQVYLKGSTIERPPKPIAAPTELAATELADDSVLLEWTDNADNETGYRIERRETGTADFAPIGAAEANDTTYKDAPEDGSYDYRVYGFNDSTQSDYSDVASVAVVGVGESDVPRSFDLSRAYPNPFNPTTALDYAVPKPSSVRITLHDAVGRKVATIFDGDCAPGFRRARVGGDLASGVYLLRFSAVPHDGSGAYEQTRKLILIK